MHKYIRLLILLFGLLLMGCEKQTSPDGFGVTEELSSVAPIENRNEWDENLYFSCAAGDGIAAFSLTSLIYQQPLIEKNVVFDYVVYEDESKLASALEDGSKSVVILDLQDSIGILQKNEDYSVVGLGRFVDSDDQTTKMAAILMTQSMLEVYPTVATGFMSQYTQGINWLMMDLKRAEAYAKQLEIPTFKGEYTLYSADNGTDSLIDVINGVMLDDADKALLIESIMSLDEGGKP